MRALRRQTNRRPSRFLPPAPLAGLTPHGWHMIWKRGSKSWRAVFYTSHYTPNTEFQFITRQKCRQSDGQAGPGLSRMGPPTTHHSQPPVQLTPPRIPARVRERSALSGSQGANPNAELCGGVGATSPIIAWKQTCRTRAPSRRAML